MARNENDRAAIPHVEGITVRPAPEGTTPQVWCEYCGTLTAAANALPEGTCSSCGYRLQPGLMDRISLQRDGTWVPRLDRRLDWRLPPPGGIMPSGAPVAEGQPRYSWNKAWLVQVWEPTPEEDEELIALAHNAMSHLVPGWRQGSLLSEITQHYMELYHHMRDLPPDERGAELRHLMSRLPLALVPWIVRGSE